MNARAIQMHDPKYLDPIVLKVGDVVVVGESSTEPEWPNWVWATLGDRAGWIPTQIVDADGRVLEDYSARELAVKPGDVLLVWRSLNGWHLASRVAEGSEGWVPAACVALLGD